MIKKYSNQIATKITELTLIVFLLLICHLDSLAQTTQDAINQQDWITRNQQNIFEEKKRNSEFETIKKERKRKKKDEAENQKAQPLVTGKTAICFPIKEIHLLDANSLSSFHKKSITSPFIGKCMEAEILAEIVKTINNYYQDKGYVTAQVKVPSQNLQSGIFELQIIEGKIEKISLGKNRLIEKMQEFSAFGNAAGDVLNINNINQGMYQINRLQSNSAVMKIEPGSEIGDSKIVIDNNKKFPAKITISKDNLGNKFTGEQRVSVSPNFDNILFLNDNLNLNYTTNIHDNSQIKDIKSFSGSFSMPFKYNTLTYDYLHSEFKGQNPGQNGPTTLTGFSQSRKIAIERVLSNKTNLRLATNASLTAKESASYLNGQKISTSERRLSIINAEFAISSHLGDSTSIYLKPAWSKGIKVLNAQQDIKNVSSSTPKAQFEIFKLYASASKRFTIPKINTAINFTSELDSQLAKQTLFGSEQFSVGGYYSVRGFRENYIAGDSGYNSRNKFNINLGSILVPLFTKKSEEKAAENFLTKNLNHLNKFSLEPFYDYGHARIKYNGNSGRMSGAGVKTIFSSKYFNAALTYSQALQKSKLNTSLIKENKMVYFELSASCC
jgi:hemolysin activation/secretion protein